MCMWRASFEYATFSIWRAAEYSLQFTYFHSSRWQLQYLRLSKSRHGGSSCCRWYLWRRGGRELLSRCWYASVLWNSKLNSNSIIGVLFGELMIIQLTKEILCLSCNWKTTICTGPSPDLKFIYITSYPFYYTRNTSALFPHQHLDHSSLLQVFRLTFLCILQASKLLAVLPTKIIDICSSYWGKRTNYEASQHIVFFTLLPHP